MRSLLFLLVVGIAVGHTCAQSTRPAPPVDPKVVFEVSLATSQREFHIGETIPLLLNFTSAVKNRYVINMAQYDRSGRMVYEQFTLSPENGAVDPLPTYTSSMGGLTTSRLLSSEPATIRINLNEWVYFAKPGVYQLAVSSSRIGINDPSRPLGLSGLSPITARSKEITLKIVAADPVWQKRVLGDAVKSLNAPAPLKPELREEYEKTRTRAVQTLRFLGTVDAAREMAKRMRGEDLSLDYTYSLGLISSPERTVARSALEEELADPDHPIDSAFLYTLRMVRSDPSNPNVNWRDLQRQIINDLLVALPGKRGKALAVSLSTAVSQAWNGDPLPQETTDKLVTQLVSMFDQLPVNEQSSLLTSRWNRIKSPALLPLLRRYAQTYKDFPEMRESNAYDSRQLSAAALRRWYELDPDGARQAFITEITRPRPRFDARVLGMLPNKTLVEVDFSLAEHFAATDDLDASSHLASLIARYATAAILPQITEQLDSKIGKWACGIQNPILAYVLRVNPALARPRIEKAVAARGENFTACNHGLFQIVSEIRYDPVLEEIGIQSLDDPDPQVAMTAATMLGRFGSAAAESALWQRYSSWSTEWSGRESQLATTFAEGANEKVEQQGLGQNLMQALATGNGWLSDRARLQRLSQLTKVPLIQQQLDAYLKIWEEQPVTILLDQPPDGFHARLVQYEFQSLNALKEKITQFPAETEFFLTISREESPASNQTLTELRTFLVSHGMRVAEQKREP